MRRRNGPVREGERGVTLLELLVALFLMGVVLVLSIFIEFTLLRRLNAQAQRIPSWSVITAFRQIEKDIREASDALGPEQLPSVPGARVLLISRDPTGADTLTVYRTDNGHLLRSQYREDGKVLRKEYVLSPDLPTLSMEVVPSVRMIVVSAPPFEWTCAMRPDASVLPPLVLETGEEEDGGGT